MRKNRICLIAFTFGKLPAYFNLWLQGALINDDYDFLIYTDDRAEYKYPSNVRVIYTTFAECVARAQKNYDFKINVPIPYKFCDFRPAFGEIFAADLKEYDFWGTIDLDIVFGKISNFITPEMLIKYNKILTHDHFCIYRNTPEVCAHYKGEQEAGKDIYKKIFTDPQIYAFGERAPLGVYFIWLYNHWPMYDGFICADIAPAYHHFEVLGETGIKKQIFIHHEDGRLVRYGILDGELVETEFMYMHLQKRFMKNNIMQSVEFGIVPDKFTDFEDRDFTNIRAMILAYNGNLMFFKDCFRIFERLIVKMRKVLSQRIINPAKRRFD